MGDKNGQLSESGEEPPPPCKARSPSPANAGEKTKVRPAKHRIIQTARTGSRKLFDASRRATFLEWFALTCNASLAAEKAGVVYQTVFKHRAKDAGFAEAWDEALAQGYAALEASLLEEALRPAVVGCQFESDEEESDLELGARPLPHVSHGPPPRSGEDLAPLTFEQRMALLREYRRAPAGRGPRAVGKAASVAGRVASDAEVEAALVKRLKAFAMRVVGQSKTLADERGDGVAGPLHHPAAPDGPCDARLSPGQAAPLGPRSGADF